MSSRWSRTTSARLLRGVSRRTMVALIAFGVIGGLGEATLLVLMVTLGTVAIGGERPGLFVVGELLPTSVGSLVVLGIVVAAVTIAAQTYGTLIQTNGAAAKMNRDRTALMRRYFGAPVTVQQATVPGEIHDHLTRNVFRASEGLLTVGQIAAGWSNLITMLTVAIVVAPVAAGSMIALGALLGAAFVPISGIVGRNSRRWADRGSDYSATVATYARLSLELRVLGVTEQVVQQAEESSAADTKAYGWNRFLQRSTPLMLRNIVLLLAFIVLGLVAALFPSAVASMAVIALILIRALAYLQVIQTNGQLLREMGAFAESVDEAFEAYAPDTVRWGDRSPASFGELSLSGVSFRHRSADHDALCDVDLTLRRGDLVAVTGPSGSGKSTLLMVLSRLVEPTTGTMTVDGTPVEELSAEAYYAAIAYLPQEVRLIPGTIADNVRFLRPADDAAVERAVAQAALTLDPARFPQGIHTPVSTEGSNLSGGQRQRIGLARALLTDPSLVLLDEPTSALDETSEREIMATISALAADRMVLMVTHRPATLAVATRVLAMADGRLTG